MGSDIKLEQHNLARSVILHLSPGALIAVFCALSARPIVAAGFPAIVALLLGILIVLAPSELGYLMVQGRKRKGMFSLDGIVVHREKIPAWQYVALVVPLLLWAGLVFANASVLDNLLSDALFRWVPDWYHFERFTEHLSAFSSTALVVTLVLLVVLNGVVGPVVEEMHFRGYLLPRISRYGKWAPVIDAILFSAYHFRSRWQFVTRLVAVLPFVSAVYWKRNICVGIATHVLVNTFGMLFLAGSILSRI